MRGRFFANSIVTVDGVAVIEPTEAQTRAGPRNIFLLECTELQAVLLWQQNFLFLLLLQLLKIRFKIFQSLLYNLATVWHILFLHSKFTYCETKNATIRYKPLYFAVVLPFFIFERRLRSSPNRTQPNFVTCLEVLYIWKWSSIIWGYPPSKTRSTAIFGWFYQDIIT